MKRKLGGVKVPHHKNTAQMQTVDMPVPETVRIPLLQHMGTACDALVKAKDEVKVGQIIGDSAAFLSVPVHSSVSGAVTAVEDFLNPNGVRCQVVVIETDGLQTLDESVQPPKIDSFEEFIAAVRRSGLVGLGGAGFPTFIKLNPKNLDEVDSLIINGAECEPYITADNREFLENGEGVLRGCDIVKKWLNLKNVYIGIEDNKPEAIEKMKALTAAKDGYSVVTLASKYPQGAEKVLIYEATGKVVAQGQLPADQGVIVMNVSSVAFVASYLETGMPLMSKRLTVDGSAVKNPQNVRALIGTKYQDVIEFCGGYKEEPKIILMGGPMMGIATIDDQFPVIKNNNAILAFAGRDEKLFLESACIRCGKCIDACPMNLMPAGLDQAYHKKDVDTLKDLKVNLCIECGCCAYVCPARRYLVQYHRLSKQLVRNQSK